MVFHDGAHETSCHEEYKSVADQIQAEVDRRYERLAACAEHPLL